MYPDSSAMQILSQYQQSPARKKKKLLFNYSNWIIWAISFGIPVFALGVVPFVKLVSETDYTGWFKDTIGNIGIISISISMVLAARFELNAENQIEGAKKVVLHILLEGLHLFLIMAGIVLYCAVTITDELLNKPLITETIVAINLVLFCAAFLFGSISFFRRIL